MGKLFLQELLDEIIKETITPELKKSGFKKLARNYYKGFEHFGLCFNIQSSHYNYEEEIKFTFNTGIFVPDLYVIYYNCELPKFPKEYECFNRRRIGELMNSSDYWYTISANTNFEALKNQIKAHFDEFIHPYFLKFNKDKDIIDLYYSKTYSKAPYDYAFLSGFIILYGNHKHGEQLLREHYGNITNDAYRETIRRYSNKLGIFIEI
ncbi:DUF4304 domain-containing protein [Clostridium omnivorum]|uniref:DUF4304 domain-containing protein n=1 Tax=Clostridium omnivorum TaxID=1604902 RepID=A0ABQ5N822_9CLOT|nr:DUF4304 domain-containing protein [Clostridium sp. E14]GLC31180.1 hypothetical protein bsdE14_25900 [Clostridium sp. E14]